MKWCLAIKQKNPPHTKQIRITDHLLVEQWCKIQELMINLLQLRCFQLQVVFTHKHSKVIILSIT